MPRRDDGTTKTDLLQIRVTPSVKREFKKVCADMDLPQGETIDALVRAYKANPHMVKGGFR